MTEYELVPVRLASVDRASPIGWAEGLRVHLPGSVLDRTGWRRGLDANGDLHVPRGWAAIPGGDAARLRERRAFIERPPLSARFPVSYRRVPAWARAAVASAVGRSRAKRVAEWAAFPGWPIDVSADVLSDLAAAADHATARAADRGGPTPVVLTHDIDSAEGLRNLVGKFLPMEEAVGARSTSYIVPCAWPVDDALVNEIGARGHEVGVHGYDHSGVTPFAVPEERVRRLDAAAAFADRAHARGYRAPLLLRTRALLRDLSSRYSYDSSIPTSGGLFPVPNNGCATVRPFQVEGILELPVTLPRDGSLRFLGYHAPQIVQTWMDCADVVARARGVVVLLTHCEQRFSGNEPMMTAYRTFLEYARDRTDRFRFSTAAEIADARLHAAPEQTSRTNSGPHGVAH